MSSQLQTLHINLQTLTVTAYKRGEFFFSFSLKRNLSSVAVVKSKDHFANALRVH